MKNKKKVTLLGVAFIAAVITLAGVGYAVTHPSYTAQTASNTGTYDVDYITLKLDAPSYSNQTNLKLTWLEVTTYTTDYVYSYTFQDSTKVTHHLILADSAASASDTLKLTASATFNVENHKLQYKLTTAGEEAWADYGTGDLFGTGVAVTNADGEFTAYDWKVVPTDSPRSTAPVTADIIMPAITYVITATQAA